MARFPVSLPPGVFRNGTQYQAKGRYYDANLVRWYGSALGPIGGWRVRSTSTVSGAARAAITWKDNSFVTWLGIGTHSNLYASDRAGDVYDITPVGFTSGRSDATSGGGYGAGDFGSITYGTTRPDTSLTLDATQWSLSTWGQYLIGVSPDDGVIYQWELDTGTAAAAVANAPACKALLVTQERFVFALATDDPRTVSWCDQEDNTDWTPTETNQAGSFPLQTSGRLMCGQNVKGGVVLLTDTDVWLSTYVGGVSIYGFNKIGESCGAISRQCMASFDMQCAWMSESGFWTYNGYVQPLACDVLDYIRTDINLLQSSKITATVNAEFSEIEWRYCSAASTEIDRCVVWNYLDGSWSIGRPSRLCGADKGAFSHPIMVDSAGTIYEHEVSFDYGGVVPYATSGPLELGGVTGTGLSQSNISSGSSGINIMHVQQFIPDDASLGGVTATFYARMQPDDAPSTFGPYTLSSKTDVRFVARLVEIRFDGAQNVAWRVGSPQLELVPGEQR